MKKILSVCLILTILFLAVSFLPAAQAHPSARAPQAPDVPLAAGGGSWERIWRSTGALFDFDCATEAECVAVGEDGLILITSDGGVTWHQEVLDAEPDLHGVDMNSRGLVLAVGEEGALYRAGAPSFSWEAIDVPTSVTLRDVGLLDDGRAWAVGDGGIILHSEDGGITWEKQPSGVAGPLYAVQFLDDQTGYAAGEKGTLLKTSDGGASWTSLTTAFPSWARIYTLFFVDSDTGFLAGQAGSLYRTEDGGQSWTKIVLSEGGHIVTSNILSIHIGNGFGVLGGANGVIATSQDGQNWTVQTAVSQDTRDVWAVFSRGEDSIWAVGAVKDAAAAAFFITHSDGMAFEPVAGDYGTQPILHEVAAPSRDVAFVVGAGGAIGRTLDGGETWHWEHFETQFPGEPILSGISCPTVDDCWVAGQVPSYPGVLYATHDGGASWEWQNPPESQWPWLYDVEMVDVLHGHAAANPYMFYTTDGGMTWRKSTVEGSTANVEIAMASKYEGWTAQRNLGHRYTTNAGKSWRRLMPYTEHQGLFFFGVETLDVNHDGGVDMGWLVGCSWYAQEERCLPDTGTVFFAQGNEDPGYAQSLPPDTAPLYTITMWDERRGWVGGEDGELLFTDTGGATWRRVDAPTSALITDIAFYETKIGFATTYAGEIMRFRGPGRNLGSFTQSTPILVDGEINDWHVGGELYLDADNAGTVLGDEPYPTPDQLSAHIYSRWTEDTLYVMAEITDDVVRDGDSFMLALDGLNDDVWGNEGDGLLIITAGGDFDAGSPDANAAIAHAVGRRAEGWVLEFAIPATWLGRHGFEQDDSIGFNVELVDDDGPDVGHTLIMEDRRLLGSPAAWGTILLFDNALTLQNGYLDYQGAEDTYMTIWGEDGHTPHGSDESLQILADKGVGYSNGLFRFTMPTLLSDTTVTDARLALYVRFSNTQPDFQIAAYRLLRPWDPDVADWYQAESGVNWGEPGAMQAGVDYDPQALDILTIPDSPRNLWLTWDISDAVTYWLQHPDENYGLLLRGVSDKRYITVYSSDYNGAPELRPKVLVDFSLNPRPTPTPTPTPTPVRLYMPLIRR